MAELVIDLRILAGADDPRPPPTQADPVDGNQSPKRPFVGPAAAYIMIVAILLGLGVGMALDRHYDTKPAWTIGLSMFFLVVGFYHVIRESRR